MVMLKEKKHVLLVAFAAQGHINPMLRLGKCLATKGLDVTLATTDSARAFHLSATSVHLEFFSDGLPLDYDRKSNIDYYMNSLMKSGPTNLTTLIQTHPKKFSCLINNPFVPWVADVAVELGIPCAMLWIQPCTLYAIYYHFYNKLGSFPTVTNPDMSVKLPGLPLLHREDLPSFVLPSNPFNSFANMLADVFLNMNKLKWVLCNSFLELEKDVIRSMNEAHPIIPVGPLVPSVLFGKEEELEGGVDLYQSEDTCIEWLNTQQPSSVIYISFGSFLYLSDKETESIALGLKKTKRPFLWVIKPNRDANKEMKRSVRILEEIKEQGLIVKWSPQTKVLAHSSIGCFLSHCGWNSLIETLTAGVPVIAYPVWTDQPTNAKLVTHVLKVGVRLETNKHDGLTGEEVERCVEEIMGGPRSKEYKHNAAELKRAAREAVADGGSSDSNIQLFVDEIISNRSLNNFRSIRYH